MSLREEQCKKVCRILDDVLANRPTERDSLIVAVQLAFESLSEPHWIPVKERLPKPRESVVISVNGKYGDWIGEGCYWETTENHVIWKGYRWNATYWDDEIIAWMPLPKPYKGVTE